MKFTRSLEAADKQRAHGDSGINILMPWDTFCLPLRHRNFKIAGIRRTDLLRSCFALAWLSADGSMFNVSDRKH